MRDKQENWELWGLQYKTKGRSPVAGLKVKKDMTVFVKDFALTFLSNFNNNMDNGQDNHSWAVVHFIADKLKFFIFRHCQQTWMSFMNKWSNHRTNNVTHSSWVFGGLILSMETESVVREQNCIRGITKAYSLTLSRQFATISVTYSVIGPRTVYPTCL